MPTTKVASLSAVATQKGGKKNPDVLLRGASRLDAKLGLLDIGATGMGFWGLQSEK